MCSKLLVPLWMILCYKSYMSETLKRYFPTLSATNHPETGPGFVGMYEAETACALLAQYRERIAAALMLTPENVRVEHLFQYLILQDM